jgi:Spy/CpxP family protein refolding chaperone
LLLAMVFVPAAVGSIAAAQYMNRGQGEANVANGPVAERPMHRMMGNRMGLTEDQQKAIAKIREDAEATRLPQIKEMMRLRTEMQSELLKDQPDQAAVHNLAQQMGDLRTQMQIKILDQRMAIRNLLTPEQRDRMLMMRRGGQGMNGRRQMMGMRRGMMQGAPGMMQGSMPGCQGMMMQGDKGCCGKMQQGAMGNMPGCQGMMMQGDKGCCGKGKMRGEKDDDQRGRWGNMKKDKDDDERGERQGRGRMHGEMMMPGAAPEPGMMGAGYDPTYDDYADIDPAFMPDYDDPGPMIPMMMMGPGDPEEAPPAPPCPMSGRGKQ